MEGRAQTDGYCSRETADADIPYARAGTLGDRRSAMFVLSIRKTSLTKILGEPPELRYNEARSADVLV